MILLVGACVPSVRLADVVVVVLVVILACGLHEWAFLGEREVDQVHFRHDSLAECGHCCCDQVCYVSNHLLESTDFSSHFFHRILVNLINFHLIGGDLLVVFRWLSNLVWVSCRPFGMAEWVPNAQCIAGSLAVVNIAVVCMRW